MFYTHVAFSIFLSILAFQVLSIENKILFLCFAIVFSLLPDLDETRSFFGRALLPISFLLKLIFGHRKLFHSFFMAIISCLVAMLLDFDIALAVFIGYGSHLLLDMLNTAGIIPLYPLSSKRFSGPMRTGSLPEKVMFLALMALILMMGLKYISKIPIVI